MEQIRKPFKIEIDGGQFNGGERYYTTYKRAIAAACKIKTNDPYEKSVNIIIDVYRIGYGYRKELINTV